MNNNQKKLNIPLLAVTAIVSILLWALALPYLHDYLIDNTSGPLAVAIVLTVFLLVISAVVFGMSCLSHTFGTDILTGYTTRGRIPLYILLAAVLCFGLAAGMEFLYETDIRFNQAPKNADTYIFVVDDSGTMQDNDPQQTRYRAIEQFVQEKPEACRYMVYTFATKVNLIQPMTASTDSGTGTLQGVSFGLTNIKAALTQVLEDYDAGVWTPGSSTMVILITDGYASDISHNGQISSLLNRFSSLRIPVSTVGLGDADIALMSHIADTTGGQMVDIQNVADMAHAFHTVTNVRRVSQTLLSDRNSASYQPVYGIIRILAITLFGALLGAICGICYGIPGEFPFLIKVSLAKAALAGVVLEVCICLLGLPPHLVCVIAGTMLGTTCARFTPFKLNPFDELDAGKKHANRTGMEFDML